MPPTAALPRRRALLALAGAVLPLAARADPPPSTETPATPPAPPVNPPPRVAPANTAAPDRSKLYYVFFEQTLDINATKALRKELVTLVEAGVTEITIVLTSPGGLLLQALNCYSFIRALPATINTHAVGLVASAANVLFLAGQHRSADRNAKFLFHPSQTTVAGSVNDQQLQEQITVKDDLDAAMAQIYRERTKLTDADIKRFDRESVFYSGEQALELDIVETVGDLRIPGEQKAKIVFIE